VCGIVGLQLRSETYQERLGELIADMLAQVRERGPDSAGVALYGDTSLCHPGWAAVSVLAGDVAAGELAARLKLAPGPAAEVAAVADVRVVTAPVPQEQLTAAVRAALPGAPLLGTGPDLAVLKGIGDPLGLVQSFGLAGRSGYQAAGHTRMATESAVTVAHSHPFSVAPGLCLVHNGSFANHDTIRRRLKAEGISFATDNDSEVAAAFVGACLADGDDLEKALRRVCQAFDGFYTLLVTTPTEFAVVRDAIACKPALIAEGRDCVVLDGALLGVRALNARLRGLPAGTEVTVTGPAGRHNLAVGLTAEISVTIDGPAGYYVGGLGQHAAVRVAGPAGWGAGENLMSGSVRVHGDASQAAAASAHGGLVVIDGNASLRAGISLKGATLAVAGDAGPFCGFMAQAGTILIGGDAGDALGDSLYEAVIYVAGAIRGLGADARVEELGEADVAMVRELVKLTGFDHIDPEKVTRVASARRLYHFTSDNHGSY
jgi:methylamine---glutamate N-methyltransferase subunit B